ncbi:MAG: 23S rRNA (pseudouridine(1915)-N(3))-methyltransferase RlmH [Blastocatellia bacterium]|nr:23S rRNA (pseudouridine(1915)-N(3))-methyltransferase RlmH [Blastocatellia bacterium]
MRLQFVWIGKTRDRHCAALTADYLARIRRFAPVEIGELKEYSGASGEDDRRVVAAEGIRILEAVERCDQVIVLEERGREFSSVEFADWINGKRETGVKRLAFIIGGFAGVSEDVKRRADLQLALSRMTLTHEMARVVLVEQVYRAFTLLAGMPYHKH